MIYHANKSKNTDLEDRFKAEQYKIFAERGLKKFWNPAGKLFYKLEDYDVALICFRNAKNAKDLARVYLKIDDEKKARKVLIESIAAKNAEIAIDVLLGEEKHTKDLKGRLHADFEDLILWIEICRKNCN